MRVHLPAPQQTSTSSTCHRYHACTGAAGDQRPVAQGGRILLSAPSGRRTTPSKRPRGRRRLRQFALGSAARRPMEDRLQLDQAGCAHAQEMLSVQRGAGLYEEGTLTLQSATRQLDRALGGIKDRADFPTSFRDRLQQGRHRIKNGRLGIPVGRHRPIRTAIRTASPMGCLANDDASRAITLVLRPCRQKRLDGISRPQGDRGDLARTSEPPVVEELRRKPTSSASRPLSGRAGWPTISRSSPGVADDRKELDDSAFSTPGDCRIHPGRRGIISARSRASRPRRKLIAGRRNRWLPSNKGAEPSQLRVIIS